MQTVPTSGSSFTGFILKISVKSSPNQVVTWAVSKVKKKSMSWHCFLRYIDLGSADNTATMADFISSTEWKYFNVTLSGSVKGKKVKDLRLEVRH